MKFSDLQEVNELVNNRVTFQDDAVTYGRSECWEVADRIGDCDDYSLAKLRELLSMGWPIEKLRLATAWCEDNLGYHAVLVVADALDESNGYVGNYVLDNRAKDIYQPSAGFIQGMRQIKYNWDRVQSEGGSKTWVKFNLD